MDKLPLKVKYLDDSIKRLSLPRKGDVGIDIYASEDITIAQDNFSWVATGVFLEVPEGYWVMVKDRSSRAKQGHVMAGVIDSSFRGMCKVGMYVHSHSVTEAGMETELNIKKGDKIAQLIIMKDFNSLFELEEVQEVSTTERNEGGFGSTGA